MDIEAAKRKLETYTAWLEARTDASAEVMTGVHAPGLERIRLDAEGLAALGWDGLPGNRVVQLGDHLVAGGYAEVRGIYDEPAFNATGEEARTLHFGLDIFCRAGAAVYAPIAGRVHSFQDNAARRDYGPTILLEHTVTPDLTFHTLYGHLSRDSLQGLEVGQDIARGERIALLGKPAENGDWPPHLHVQVILDLMGKSGDYPGVFCVSEGDHWKLICPDPAKLLGIN